MRISERAAIDVAAMGSACMAVARQNRGAARTADATVDTAALSAEPMRVALSNYPGQTHTWLRFGVTQHIVRLDAWRRIAVFLPGAICCRVQWRANAYGPVFWQLMVLQAGTSVDVIQRVAGVAPGARILLHTQGERRVTAALALIDQIGASDVALTDVSPAYWRTVNNRLAARLALPAYSAERHDAYLARRLFAAD